MGYWLFASGTGYRLAGQKSFAFGSAAPAGQVRSARKPPELVRAKSVPYWERMASVTRSPMSDSHARPSTLPVAAVHASARGMTTVDFPRTVLKIGASWAL